MFAGVYLFLRMQRRKEGTERGGHIGGNKWFVEFGIR